MDLHEKIRTLPTQPGVYLYKNAEGEVIYVGKAKNLRSRVRSYLLEASQANAKTGSLMREAVDVDYILVANEHEALALENNLIKQRKPRFNILLRDDKTYPYVKLTLADRYPKVFVTRRLRKDGSRLLRPLLSRQSRLPRRRADPSQLSASQLQSRSLALPSARLPAVLHPALPWPCVEGLTTPEMYKQAVRDAQLFLEGKSGRTGALAHRAHGRRRRSRAVRSRRAAPRPALHRAPAAGEAAHRHRRTERRCRRLRLSLRRRQPRREPLPHARRQDRRPPRILLGRPAGAAGSIGATDHDGTKRGPDHDADPADQRSAISRSTPAQSSPPCSSSSTSTSTTSRAPSLCRSTSPTAKRSPTLLSERTGHRVEIAVPQRGEKRSLVDLAGQNAKQSLHPALPRAASPRARPFRRRWPDALMLPELPRAHRVLRHLPHPGRGNRRLAWSCGKTAR